MDPYAEEFENASSDDDDNERKNTAAPSSSAAAPAIDTTTSTRSKAVEDALALGIWKAVKDESTGKQYYYHTISQKTTWDLDKELAALVTTPTTTSPSATAASAASANFPTKSPTTAAATGKPPLPGGPHRASSSAAQSPGATMPSDAGALRYSVDSTADSSTDPNDHPSFDVDGKPMFKELTGFVAFGSFAAASTTDDEASAQRQRMSEDATSAGDVRKSVDGGGAFAAAAATKIPEDTVVTSSAPLGRLRARYVADDENPFTSPLRMPPAPVETASSKSISAAPGLGAESSKAKDATDDKKKESDDSSSAFSTLSEVAPKKAAPVVIPPAASATPAAAEVLAPDVSTRTAAPSQVPPVPPLTFAFKPYDPFATTASAQQQQQLPSSDGLGHARGPQTSLSLAQASVGLSGPVAVSNMVAPQSSAANITSSLLVAPQTVQQPVSAKILELRETTDAVERLVRAFVTLRGHDVGGPADVDYHQATRALGLEKTALPSRGFGSLKERTEMPPSLAMQQARERLVLLEAEGRLAQHQQKQAAGTGSGVSEAIQEKLLEEEMCDMVLSLMVTNAASHARFHPQQQQQQHKSSRTGTAESKPKQSSKQSLRQPLAQVVPRETVTVSAWRSYSQQPSTARPYGRGVSLSSSALNEAFAFDVANLAALATAPREELEQLIISSLDKYVVNRVAAKKIAPALAKVVLIDLADVMTEIILERFRGSSGSGGGNATAYPSDGPVFVQFDGPAQLGPAVRDFALSAIHALPFEDLDDPAAHDQPASSSSMKYARRRFRLDHWVSRENALVVLNALHATLRRLEQICSDGYDVFSTSPGEKVAVQPAWGVGGNRSKRPNGNTKKDEDGGIPFFVTELPLFSLLPSMYKNGVGLNQPQVSAADEEESKIRPATASSQRPDIILGRFVQDEDILASLLLPLSGIALDVQRRVTGSSTAAGLPDDDENEESRRPQQLPASVLQSLVNEATLETVAELLSDVTIAEAVQRKAHERARKAVEERVTLLHSRRHKGEGRTQADNREGTKVPASSAAIAKMESENRTRRIQQVQEAELKVNKLVSLIRQEIEAEDLAK